MYIYIYIFSIIYFYIYNFILYLKCKNIKKMKIKYTIDSLSIRSNKKKYTI